MSDKEFLTGIIPNLVVRSLTEMTIGQDLSVRVVVLKVVYFSIEDTIISKKAQVRLDM